LSEIVVIPFFCGHTFSKSALFLSRIISKAARIFILTKHPSFRYHETLRGTISTILKSFHKWSYHTSEWLATFDEASRVRPTRMIDHPAVGLRATRRTSHRAVYKSIIRG